MFAFITHSNVNGHRNPRCNTPQAPLSQSRLATPVVAINSHRMYGNRTPTEISEKWKPIHFTDELKKTMNSCPSTIYYSTAVIIIHASVMIYSLINIILMIIWTDVYFELFVYVYTHILLFMLYNVLNMLNTKM